MKLPPPNGREVFNIASSELKSVEPACRTGRAEKGSTSLDLTVGEFREGGLTLTIFTPRSRSAYTIDMRERLHKHVNSFRYAWAGIMHAVMYEHNFIIHLLIGFNALLLALLLKISIVELAIIILTITLGLATELANTAIENITDLITKEHRLEAKIAKDVGAGMMLIVAIGSIMIAVLIFLPYLFHNIR